MAEDLTRPPPGPPQLPPTAEPAAETQEQPKRHLTPFHRRERRGRYRLRFLLAYVILALLLGGAAAGFGLLMMSGTDGGGDDSTGGWSDWKPTARGEAGVDQIANFVAGQYKLPSGRQLVAVVADQPLVQNQIPVSTVAIDSGSGGGGGGGNDYTLHDTGGDYMYVLCGLGQNCAIPEGTASVERHRLVRREALELALYTFRYVDGVDSIIAFLPPPLGQQPTSLLFFRKKDFEHLLERPLHETISAKPPPIDEMPASERRIIDRLTTKNLFRYEFQQGPDASAILVLTPQSPSN
jgi:hypothetical protein